MQDCSRTVESRDKFISRLSRELSFRLKNPSPHIFRIHQWHCAQLHHMVMEHLFLPNEQPPEPKKHPSPSSLFRNSHICDAMPMITLSRHWKQTQKTLTVRSLPNSLIQPERRHHRSPLFLTPPFETSSDFANSLHLMTQYISTTKRCG